MTLNADLRTAHFQAYANKDKNLHTVWDSSKSVRGGGMRQPGMPGGARVITLRPGQTIFRWADTGVPDPTASPWWSSKRASQAILKTTLHNAQALQSADTSGAARHYSGVARSWSNLGQVVVLRLNSPVKCFMGMGRPVEDDFKVDKKSVATTTYDEELQIYIPNMSERNPSGGSRRTAISKPYFHILGTYPSDQFFAWHWVKLTGLDF